MPSSESRKHFEDNFTEIDHLIDIQEALVSLDGEDDDGEICDFTDQRSVLIKSSIVLMVSHWEAGKTFFLQYETQQRFLFISYPMLHLLRLQMHRETRLRLLPL